MRDLWLGAQLHKANPTPSGMWLLLRGKGDAKGHVAASLNEKECKAVQISAHQSLHWNQEMLWFGSTGDKATISFKVYLMRQKEAASFDSFTALIRLHQN